MPGIDIPPAKAYDLAESLLSHPLPRRWRHTVGVGSQAESLTMLGPDKDILHSAAFLHDIGYTPDLVRTGFHAIDGARYLRDVIGADDRIVRLVAHHSCAAMEAKERGLAAQMVEFKPEDDLLADALIYCDMTTTPDGDLTRVEDRIAEIVDRYGNNSIVGQFINRAAPYLIAATERVGRLQCGKV